MDSGGARGGDDGHGRHHLGQLRPATWSFAGGGGVPWPVAGQRSSSSYMCGYCKREFRSAQALGGHMNVHRRERARLCYYYSCAAAHRVLPNLNFAPAQYHCSSDTTTTRTRTPPAVYSFFSTAAADAATSTAAKAAALEVNVELGAGGGFGDGGGGGGGGLDLELRLGCS